MPCDPDQVADPGIADHDVRGNEVLDGKIELTAHLLHPADNLAGIPFCFKVREECHIDIHGCVFHGSGEDIQRQLLRKRHVRRRDLERVGSGCERCGTESIERRLQRCAVSALDCSLDLRGVLRKCRAEHLHDRLGLPANPVPPPVDHRDLPAVRTLAADGVQAGYCVQHAARAGHDHALRHRPPELPFAGLPGIRRRLVKGLGTGHVRFKRIVGERRIAGEPVEQVHALRVIAAPQVPVDGLGDVRAEGREDPGQPAKDEVDRLVRMALAYGLAFEPHPLPDELDVPA